ncbi:MAG: TraR/DksA C4-type zinc finger protein, partial [Gammaproteobacteria bacterium]|nr:TraR/DksA C4-type zinc finger protein [Gammaproteobacteria bacterium]
MTQQRTNGEFRERLGQRFQALRDEVRRALLDLDGEHFVDLAGQVRDLEESAVADMLVDLDLTLLDMHIQEMRDIEAAQIRLDRDEYGVCVDCSETIDVERLRAYPTAKRCLACQKRYEQSHATPRGAT